jgi:hypothetical protein
MLASEGPVPVRLERIVVVVVRVAMVRSVIMGGRVVMVVIVSMGRVAMG